MRRAVILLIGIAGIHTVATAAEAFKNGQPCMDGLCIGDGLPEVAKMKWDPAVVHVPFGDKRKTEIEKTYRGDLRKAMPYLAGSGFERLPAAM